MRLNLECLKPADKADRPVQPKRSVTLWLECTLLQHLRVVLRFAFRLLRWKEHTLAQPFGAMYGTVEKLYLWFAGLVA
jgi:hypothetical protein